MKFNIFNPFVKIAGIKALTIGLAVALVGTFLAWKFNTNFDGALDVHYGNSESIWTHLIFQLINLSSLILSFYVVASILTRGRTRIIDIAGTITLARFPLLVAPLLNVVNKNTRIGRKIVNGVMNQMQHSNASAKQCLHCTMSNSEYIYFAISTIILLFLLTWYVILLFNAYKTSSNLKNPRLAFSFMLALILAEILSSTMINIAL